jgi:hypothetical protein
MSHLLFVADLFFMDEVALRVLFGASVNWSAMLLAGIALFNAGRHQPAA